MIKTVLKVLYVGFALIIAFLVYMVGYNSNGFNHIQTMTTDAIAKNDYVEVAKIHGGCFDSVNIVEENNIVSGKDALDMAIFPGADYSSVSYYEKNNDEYVAKTKNVYNDLYYIYIFNPTFQTQDVNINGTYSNRTGVRFTSNEGSYDYYFTISSEINSSLYQEYPLSYEDTLLHGTRSLTNNYTNWDFYSLPITSDMIQLMQTELNGDINSISVLDSSAAEIYKLNVQLDFSQQFFNDIAPLVENFNQYLEEVDAASLLEGSAQSDAITAAQDKFNAFTGNPDEGIDGFLTTFLQNERYTYRYGDSVLRPGVLVWQTIGMLVIYLVCVALLYMLLFHFNFLKGLISKNKNYRKNPGARKYAPQGNRNANANTKPRTNKADAISAEVQESETKSEENKE